MKLAIKAQYNITLSIYLNEHDKLVMTHDHMEYEYLNNKNTTQVASYIQNGKIGVNFVVVGFQGNILLSYELILLI